MRRNTLRSALASSKGAIDLASIMAGVLVIGLVAGVIAAVVFAVVPWAHDRTAQETLRSVQLAESVVKAQESQYIDGKALAASKVANFKANGQVAVGAADDGNCFVAVAQSPTGKTFVSTSRSSSVAATSKDTDTSWCVPLDEVVSNLEGPGTEAPSYVKLTWENTFVGESWYSVAASSSGNVAVGLGRSGIYMTHDRGDTWVLALPRDAENYPQYSATVAISGDGSKIVAQTYTPAGACRGTVRSEDSGTTWTPGPSLSGCGFTAMSTAGESVFVADSTSPNLWESADSGETFTARQVKDIRSFHAFSVSGNGKRMIAAGATAAGAEVVYVSSDSGATWQPVSYGSAQPVSAAAISTNGSTFYLGVAGPTVRLLSSNDRGATWVDRTPTDGVTTPFTSIGSSKDGSKLIVGSYSAVFLTIDGGATWRPEGMTTSMLLGAASSADGAVVYLASYNVYVTRGQYTAY